MTLESTINSNFSLAKAAIADCAPASLVQTVNNKADVNHTHSGYLTQHQDISGKENISNKVTSLSSSSTNTQYPSAKCVYDLIGNVETLLQAV